MMLLALSCRSFKWEFWGFFSPVHFTMWSFYDLTAHRSIERPSVLIHFCSLESLLAIYSLSLVVENSCVNIYMLRKEKTIHKIQKDSRKPKTWTPWCFWLLCGWGCAIKRQGTKSLHKELCGDKFLVSELVLWEPLWKEKKEVGIKIGGWWRRCKSWKEYKNEE